uniref:Uncharacterized protein n=1 Tax=Arundo donax TaxID=35708 RepID=A0A0A8YQ75_ARUDO
MARLRHHKNKVHNKHKNFRTTFMHIPNQKGCLQQNVPPQYWQFTASLWGEKQKRVKL